MVMFLLMLSIRMNLEVLSNIGEHLAVIMFCGGVGGGHHFHFQTLMLC